MKVFVGNGRLRKTLSAIVAFAMMFSIVALPAGAAVPSSTSDVSVTPGGTNLDRVGDVTVASNGLNGDVSVEVTGSLPTRSRLEGAKGALTDATKLSACGVTVYSKFKVWYGGPGQAAVATTITGLTSTATVGVLRAKIEAQLPNVTTSIEPTANRLWLTADQFGRCPLATTDVTNGVGPKIFGTGLVGQRDAFGNPLGVGTTRTFGRTFSGGTGYDGAYFGGGSPLAVNVSFSAAPDISYPVGTATLGILDGGAFVARTNDAGLYTAVKLPRGYDVVLTTSGGLGIAHGTATATLAGGTRDLAKPDFRIRQARNPVLVGGTTTLTAQISGMPFTAGAGGVDQITFTLPEGFTPSDVDATAMVGDTAATLVIDSGARTVTASDFFATEDQPLTISFASQVPTVAGEYPVSGTYRNFNDSATGTVNAVGKIKVVDLGLEVTASPALNGDASYGCALVGDEVTFSVKTNVPKAGVSIVASAASSVGTGTLEQLSAVTDENGVATFVVTSDSESDGADIVRYGLPFKRFNFACEDDPTLTAAGYAHFYNYAIRPVSVSKCVAFADGQDEVTYGFSVLNPVTHQPAPEGTRIYFASAGFDRDDTMVSPSSALTDADGNVSTGITREDVTDINAVGTSGLAWVAPALEDEFKMSVINSGPVDGIQGVNFMDYIATTGAPVTAQQSARGAAAHGDYVIKDASGATVAFDTLAGVIEATSTDVLKSSPLTSSIKYSKIHLDVEVKADDGYTVRKAGDVVQAALMGYAGKVGSFGSEQPIVFGIDMPITIVNNATAVGRGSIYLAKANVTGTGFKPGTPSIRAVQGDNSYALTGATIGVDLDGIARPQSFDMPVMMLKGTYDLVIDGITFPGALVVGDGISIGVSKVVITLGASKGVYPNYATKGSTVTLFGLVTTTGNANVPTSIANVYTSTKPDGSDAVFIGQVLTSNGQFGYRVVADKGRYYWATTEQNGQYLPGDSRDAFGEPLYVGVKTYASVKITSAPSSARATRDFMVRGTLPSHSHETTVVVRAYKLIGRKYVLKHSFETAIPVGTTTFSRVCNITTKGSWMIGVSHSDYDHLMSVSKYRALVVK